MEGHGRRTFRAVVGVLLVLIAVAAAFVYDGMSRGVGTAKVTYAHRYTRCGDIVTSLVEMPAGELAGALAAVATEWTVTESGDSSATVQKDIEGFCPEHEDFRLIALFRGTPAEKYHVCVFRGKKIDPDFMTKERRDLSEDALYPQDRERLRAGILITREDADPPDVSLDEKAGTFLQGIGEGR